MKTKFYISLLSLSLVSFSLMAGIGSEGTDANVSNVSNLAAVSSRLAPEVPAEATFEEEITTDGYSSEFLESIKPEVPQEAEFEDAE